MLERRVVFVRWKTERLSQAQARPRHYVCSVVQHSWNCPQCLFHYGMISWNIHNGTGKLAGVPVGLSISQIFQENVPFFFDFPCHDFSMNLSSPRPRPRPRSRFLHAGARQAAELPVTMTFQTLGNKEFCTNCQDWQSESDILWMMVMLCGFFLHFEYDKISWGNDFGGLFSVELIHLVHSKLVDFNRF